MQTIDQVTAISPIFPFFHEILNLYLEWDGEAVTRINLGGEHVPISQISRETPPLIKEAKAQLAAYLNGQLQELTFPAKFLQGTPFQREVWNALLQIPYGQTWSYQELAASIAHPNAIRAVGNALRVNPLPLRYPCHRIIHKDKTLGGFGGASPALAAYKYYLLSLEQQSLSNIQTLLPE